MLVEASGLVKAYPRVRALDGVSIEVREGEIFGLFGPNGAGKTTCLRVLSGLTPPDAGDARVCGVDVRRDPTDVRRRLGILIDIPFPYEEMTVQEYLTFFARLAGLSPPDVRARVAWAMTFMGQGQHARSRIGRLSMGERQRTELARVILSRSQALFLDEPFSNVDIEMRVAMRKSLKEWVSEGRAVLFTSHNLLESEAIVDRFAFLHLGRVVAVGTAKELKEKLLAPAYVLEVSDADRALNLLTAVPHQSLERAGPTGVRIGLLDRNDAAAIARALVGGGVDLLEMRSVGTMEDVYARLASTGAPVAAGGGT